VLKYIIIKLDGKPVAPAEEAPAEKVPVKIEEKKEEEK
jgi:hypothetical protein